MSSTRLQLHNKLKQINPNVYYQPLENVKLVYPCIIYELADITSVYASNTKYMQKYTYNISAIYKNPDAPIVEQILDAFDYIDVNRFVTVDNLYHAYFNITILRATEEETNG